MPPASLQSKGQQLTSSWVLCISWEKPIPIPPALHQPKLYIIPHPRPLSPTPLTPYHLPAQDSIHVEASPNSGAPSREQAPPGANQDAPSLEGQEVGALCSTGSASGTTSFAAVRRQSQLFAQRRVSPLAFFRDIYLPTSPKLQSPCPFQNETSSEVPGSLRVWLGHARVNEPLLPTSESTSDSTKPTSESSLRAPQSAAPDNGSARSLRSKPRLPATRPQVPAARRRVQAPLASERLRKKGGRDPRPRGRLPPGSPSSAPHLQPFSQTQLGSRELSRSRSHPDLT